MLANKFESVKLWIAENTSDIYVAVLIFLVSVANFGLGRLSILWPSKQPITIPDGESAVVPAPHNTSSQASAASAVTPPTPGKYVASKSGKSYHFPWCPGATNINEQNKTWFQTKEAAEQAGYKPAANCPGL